MNAVQALTYGAYLAGWTMLVRACFEPKQRRALTITGTALVAACLILSPDLNLGAHE